MLARRHLLATAGIALALSGRTLRAAANPVAPWSAAPAAADPDRRIRALHWAVLAPNPHNRQPWLLELADNGDALLRCDLDRRLPETDPLDRQILIGLGCFAELFRLAAAAQGYDAAIDPFPDGAPAPRLDGRPIARFRLQRGGSPDPLFAQAGARRSTKRPFDLTRPVEPGALPPLAAAVGTLASFGATTEPDAVAGLRALTWRAWRIEAETHATHMESVRLIRLGAAEVAAQPDGISLYGPAIEPAIAAGQLTRESLARLDSPAAGRMMEGYRAMLAATPAFAWLTTPGNTRAEQFAAGRAWLRLNLATTAAGLALHPVSQALQEFAAMDDARAAAHALLAPSGGTVQMLGRIGYAPPPAAPPTPRWPAGSRILRG
jgi:hypothetical protein